MSQQDEHGSHHLTEQERAIVGLQVDHFIELMSKRYGIEPKDVVDAVRWVQEHKEMTARVRHAGIVSLIGVVASALAISLYEGVRAALWRP